MLQLTFGRGECSAAQNDKITLTGSQFVKGSNEVKIIAQQVQRIVHKNEGDLNIGQNRLGTDYIAT